MAPAPCKARCSPLGGKAAGQLQEFLIVVQKCDSRNTGIDGNGRPGGGARSRARIKQGPGRKLRPPSACSARQKQRPHRWPAAAPPDRRPNRGPRRSPRPAGNLPTCEPFSQPATPSELSARCRSMAARKSGGMAFIDGLLPSPGKVKSLPIRPLQVESKLRKSDIKNESLWPRFCILTDASSSGPGFELL